MDEEEKDIIEELNISQIIMYLIREYNVLLTKKEIEIIKKQAKLIYKMIKENKNSIQENGITYYLDEDIKKYLEDKLIKE